MVEDEDECPLYWPATIPKPGSIPEKLARLKGYLRELPLKPDRPRLRCAYFLFWHRHIIYVGQTTDLWRRIEAHRSRIKFDRVLYVEATDGDLDRIERKFIRELRPLHNGGVNSRANKAREARLRKTDGL